MSSCPTILCIFQIRCIDYCEFVTCLIEFLVLEPLDSQSGPRQWAGAGSLSTGEIMELLSPAFVFSLSVVAIVVVTVLSIVQRPE